MSLKKKPGAKDPSTITPEYIAQKRKERELKKQQKRDELLKQGIDPDNKPVPEHLQFIKRPLQDIPNQKLTGKGLKLTILTYNMLAQALIRRKLFPTSGTALKWSNRSQRLSSEIGHYNADIVCLQELDFDQFNSYWKKEFTKMGYSYQYHRSGVKRHGVAILYKTSLFKLEHYNYIDYDSTVTPGVATSTQTQNVGLLAYLKFQDSVKSSNPGLSRDGIIVGTTHLFWHPFGTFERTRQTYIVLLRLKEFTKMVHLLCGAQETFYRFFAGDFNAQPYDAPYLSITSKPIKYEDRVKIVLGKAASHQWSGSEPAEDEGDDEEVEQDVEEEDEEDTPEPKEFTYTPEILNKLQAMENLHNELDMRFISLYSVAYRDIHPENTIPRDRYEPLFSNWAHAWRGLLDYIFVASDWHGEETAKEVDSLEQLEQQQRIKLLSLLRMPTPEEMGPEPSGQPRNGQYPSDHLCLMAKLELL